MEVRLQEPSCIECLRLLSAIHWSLLCCVAVQNRLLQPPLNLDDHKQTAGFLYRAGAETPLRFATHFCILPVALESLQIRQHKKVTTSSRLESEGNVKRKLCATKQSASRGLRRNLLLRSYKEARTYHRIFDT